MFATVATSACYNGTSRRLSTQALAASDYEDAVYLSVEALRLNPQDEIAMSNLKQASSGWAGESVDNLRRAHRGGGSEAAIVQAHAKARALRQFDREFRLGLRNDIETLEGLGTQLAAGQADQNYERGKAALDRQDLETARDAFAQALYYRPEFPEARDGIVKTYSALGDRATQQRLYRAATEAYGQVLHYDARNSRARNRLVEAHLALAEWYRDNGHPRLELADLIALRSVDPTYPQIEQRIADARDRATTRLAVLPLNPNVAIPRTLGNFDAIEVLRDRLASKLANRASEFIRMIDRQNTKKLIDEIYFSRSDFVRDGMKLPIDAFEVCDTLIAGNLTQLEAVGPVYREIPVRDSASVALYRQERRRDQNGQEILVWVHAGYAQVDYSYVRVDVSSSAALAGSAMALDVATSRSKSQKSFSLSDSDATSFTDSINIGWIPPAARMSEGEFMRRHVSGEARQLLQAPREVRPPSQMLEGMIETITTEWAVDILRSIDTTPSIPEPFGRR